MTHPDAVDAWDYEPTPKLTDRERLLAVKLLFQQNVVEVKNDIGGVVGYTLSLNEETTRQLWNLISLLGV